MSYRTTLTKLMMLWVLVLSLVGPAHAVQHFDHHKDLVNCAWCFHGDQHGKSLTPSLPTLPVVSGIDWVQDTDVDAPVLAPRRCSQIRAPPQA
ncbi:MULTISPECIES: hypothetical protein [Ferrimonas]|uniref:hypothetical protein n=1 Tax=Ferrimonas TaxID=44011 RepID=UPI0012EB42E2|nr:MULTISPECIES: hypothetical protein [Ferrimonas]USD37111.1 hypothetical protein J8Z22_19335 [Ferrimonas sp. SCSIO 43195]